MYSMRDGWYVVCVYVCINIYVEWKCVQRYRTVCIGMLDEREKIYKRAAVPNFHTSSSRTSSSSYSRSQSNRFFTNALNSRISNVKIIAFTKLPIAFQL